MNLARSPWWRKWFGTRSERAAKSFLKRQGFCILRTNFSCKFGELDLVARDGDCLVFVEVRSTGTDDLNRAAMSVDHKKQRQLTKLAEFFLQKYHLENHNARFDVIAIAWPNDQKDPTIQHFPNAFEATN